MSKHKWPAWFYGPNGQAKIFHSEGEVPSGWHDHPSKHKAHPLAAAAEGIAKTHAPAPTPAHALAKASDSEEKDAHGHVWSADLHAATRSKTGEGLWRMKVGVKRPAPLLDL